MATMVLKPVSVTWVDGRGVERVDPAVVVFEDPDSKELLAVVKVMSSPMYGLEEDQYRIVCVCDIDYS